MIVRGDKLLPGTGWGMPGPKTIANTAAETDIFAAPENVPIGALTVGSHLRVVAYGRLSTAAATSLAMRIYLGANVAAVVTTAANLPSGLANAAFRFESLIDIITAGAAGTMNSLSQVIGNVGTGGALLLTDNPGPQVGIAINTTIAEQFKATWQWGVANAGNTITFTEVVLEIPIIG